MDTGPDRPALHAVAPAQRLALLDVLRGFAILGILFVNVHFYSRPIYAVFRDLVPSSSAVDRAVVAATNVLVTEKFFSILSVLFGIGTAILVDRAAARGTRFAPVYLRRLVGLFVIGIAHALLLYSGDFIGNYAVLGLGLWLFVRVRGKWLLAAAAVVLMVPVAMMAPRTLAGPPPAPAAQEQPTEQDRQAIEERRERRREAMERRIRASVEAYGEGTFAELFRLRAGEVRRQYSSLLFVGWKMFAMFLVGMWCWRSGLVRGVDRDDGQSGRWIAFVKRAMWIAGAIGAACTAFSLYAESAGAPLGPGAQLAAFAAQEIGAPALALFYVSAITLLFRRADGRRLLAPLAPVGRMAMSNYVFQSIVCTNLFYSYGLGWFGKVGYATAAGIAVVICAAQVVLSRWWFGPPGTCRFGPLEWVLRTWVYGTP